VERHYKFILHDGEVQFGIDQRCAISRYFSMEFLSYRRCTVQFLRSLCVRADKIIVAVWNVITA